MQLRQTLYRLGIFKTTSFSVPIVVVGNLTVGGNGKTPLIIALAELLSDLGMKPGIVSRGYGGQCKKGTLRVYPDSDARVVGDEPLLLARHLSCPVVIGVDRVAAVKTLLAHHDCDIILSDDGLQHLAMGRSMEIIVVNEKRGFGNGFCLPAGPLRESLARVKTTPWVVYNVDGMLESPLIKEPLSAGPGHGDNHGAKSSTILRKIQDLQFSLEPHCFRSVVNPQITKPLNAFLEKEVIVVSAIGYPEGFLNTLQVLGIQGQSHFFRDHHQYTWEDLVPYEHKILLMTEKDAVKCAHFSLKDAWYLEVKTVLSEVLEQRLREFFKSS